jgi:hypothetical protein
MTTTAPGKGSSGAKIVGEPRPRRPLPNTRLRNALYIGKIALGILLVPFWPIFMAVEAKDAYYVNHYFLTLYHSLRTLRHSIQNGTWKRIFKYNLWTSAREVEERLGSRLGACTRCAKCCKMLQCTYLAYDQRSHEYTCSVYNTPFWIFGACGRYPIDERDIDDYNCPGFAFPESVERARAAGRGLIQIGRVRAS